MKKRNWNYWIGICTLFLTACTGRKEKSTPVLFDVLDHTKTGLDFSNNLSASPDFNMLKYMYFYNGAGVGAGDFNNDGKIDLFFASNQSQNKIYLNDGDLQFTDITTAAKIPDDGGWSTGVSIADVNDDGLLDIYVCRVGHFESLQSKNQLLICKGVSETGIPYYNDEAGKYGVDFSGFSTQAAFLILIWMAILICICSIIPCVIAAHLHQEIALKKLLILFQVTDFSEMTGIISPIYLKRQELIRQ